MRSNPIILALDTDDLAVAEHWAERCSPWVGGLKLGMELWTAAGQEGYRRMASWSLPMFLDLKWHDIPNTVGRTARQVASLPGLRWVTVHSLGGAAMVRAAREVLPASCQLLAVTLLTSTDARWSEAIGFRGTLTETAECLQDAAQEGGADGVVCAAEDLGRLGRRGLSLRRMVPGIRPWIPSGDDQQRIATVEQALTGGADWLVIGRPITQHKDPEEAAREIHRRWHAWEVAHEAADA